MTRRFACLFGSAVLAAVMAPPAPAQEYSNGGTGAAGRKAAILTPVEAFGVHPPGIDPADAQRRCARLRQRYVPYYAPLSPVASTARWRPWGYYPLLPFYTPYYAGYSPHRLFNPPPRPYGWNGWGAGPAPELALPEEPDTTPLDFGPYTSVVEDDTTYWNMGGNGLVPYGAAEGAATRPFDLVDEIQASRPRIRIKVHSRRAAQGRPGARAPSADAGETDDRDPGRSSQRRTKPAEPIPPGAASQEEEEQEYDLGPDRSGRQTKPAQQNRRRNSN
ncbi:MAG TPA: hypothetical protein VGX78_06370 [Pirellulales bacterium]|nr:hypothetical protein [Pirellulales bacterium]